MITCMQCMYMYQGGEKTDESESN